MICRRAASFFFLVATASQVSWDSREASPPRVLPVCHRYNEGSVSMDLQPLGDRLIVEVLDEEETTIGGIVLPDTAREKPQRGKVLAAGPGSRDDKGELVPMEVAVGDEIVFSKYGGTEVKVGLEDLLILRESDVLAKAAGVKSKSVKSKKDKSPAAGATA
jgi:chaperonin GroES